MIARLVGDARHHVQVAGVVAVNDMDGQTERFQHAEGAGCDDIAAVQHGLGTSGFGGADGGRQQWAVVVTVGNDTDFHGDTQKLGFSGAFLYSSTLSRISRRASSIPAQPSTRTHLPSSRSL